MKSLKNSVQLIGRLGKDPEVKSFDNGKTLATFSIATSDYYKNHKGERIEETQWHQIVTWGKTAEIAGKYLKKGAEVAIEGKLTHRTYDSPQGERRYITEVHANELVMLGGKPSA
jgi:single-strand DNA-binding protein